MKKRWLSLLLCLSFVLALVPTAAMAVDAGDSLQPADQYYTLDGEVTSGENPDITLSKTAVKNDDGTYTVTLTAEAKEKVSTRSTEVVFLLDTSASMRWCADGKANGCDHNGWDGVWCDRVEKGETKSRLDEAKGAINTVVSSLSKNDSTTMKYVHFGGHQVGSKWVYDAEVVSSYDSITRGNGGTPLTLGTKKALEQFTDADTNKVLIIVADGDSNDGYPNEEIKAFKEAGGIVFAVGFTFSGAAFKALASQDGSYTANNADELNVAMNEITTKVAGLICDPMGDDVELVGSVEQSGGYENAKLWTSDDGRTVYWTNKDGLNNKVTLTYTVKISDAAMEAAKENGADISLNKNATLNYEMDGKVIQLPFPVPVAHLDRELKNYTLTYESNGGTKFVDETYQEGTEVTITNVPKQDGCIFKGWYADKELTQNVTKVTMNSDMTVYAKWAKEYTLTYESNGGTKFVDETYLEGTEVTITNVPKQDGYIFKGWYADKELTQNVTKVTMNSDMTVYAKWAKEYTLTYESNGGTKYQPDKYEAGTEVPMSKIPKKDGNTFVGWYTDKELTQNVTRVTMNSDMTVYAKWKADETPVLEKGDHSAYIVGCDDGLVCPEKNLTRAEVAAIFYRLLTDEARETYYSDTNPYSDVNDKDWYNIHISTLTNMKILSGCGDGTFHPNDPVTRAEFASIAARFSDGPADDYADFEDVPTTHWGSKHIAKAAKLGWISGDGNGKFRPEDNITRAEAMSLVNRVLERGVDKEGICEGTIQWPDNTDPSVWYYYVVQEATNSHEYARTDRSIKGQSFCYEEWIQLKPNRE